MRYSKHFDSVEFLVSANHPGLAQQLLPDGASIEAMKWGSIYVLESIRDRVSHLFGKEIPIIITSGYRNGMLNNAVGGSATSHHMSGHAADITFEGINDLSAKALARSLINDIPALQYILVYQKRSFWHVAWPPIHNYKKYWREIE